ncbi:hypothetical protein ACFFX1_19205 [Dactylosporangium sucinum]|uniref:Uncharacterized protein n=1 Tax=Dactylosporangium sucinum TaxID=1424081 RepID=A0A917TZI3_9ACTN|nr:hypothetical protein [Dactylosporangium sucinum]GGM47385.1 hypothetical protein GCM10007977_056280 [Dactylosporangium sucinum]
MSIPHARRRPSTSDKHRYDTAYVVVAIPIPEARPDAVAPPLVYRLRKRP